MSLDRNEKLRQLWSVVVAEGNLLTKLYQICATNEINTIVIQSPSLGDIQLSVKRANAIGENYMSETFSLSATQNKEEFKAFCKILPANAIMREAAIEIQTHDHEVGVYYDLFPILQKIRQDANLQANQVSLKVPVPYHVEIDSEAKNGRAILMEDLKFEGFRSANRTNGCDVNHLKVALNALADYHALTIAYLQGIKTENGSYDIPDKLSFVKGTAKTDELMLDVAKSSASHHIKYFKENGYPELGNWIEEVTLNECDPLFIEPDDPEGLLVINHGDYWINNMMFRYEDSIPVDIKLVDWQLPKIGHPGRDVAYFIYSCTTEETRKEHMDQLLKDYFFNLKASLSLLGVDLEEITSWECFLKAMKKNFMYAMYMAFLIIPLTLDTDFANHLQDADPAEENQPTEKEGDFCTRFIEATNEVIATKGIAIAKSEHLCKRLVDILLEIKLMRENS